MRLGWRRARSPGTAGDPAVGPDRQDAAEQLGQMVGVGPQYERVEVRGDPAQTEEGAGGGGHGDLRVGPGQRPHEDGLEELLGGVGGVGDEAEVQAPGLVEGVGGLAGLAGVLLTQQDVVAVPGHEGIRSAARQPGPAYRQTQ